MWKVHGRAYSVAACAAVFACVAFASGDANAQQVINQNISGFNLPGVSLPQGHDEVRAADGTTCRSAVSGNGAYLDMGFIGNPEQSNTDGSVAAYTRVVIPLGEKRGRVDCRKLYDLEVRRLEIELKLMELGLNRGIAPASETEAVPIGPASNENGSFAGNSNSASADNVELAKAEESSWETDGWSTEGLNN